MTLAEHPVFEPVPPRVTPAIYLAGRQPKSKWTSIVGKVREAARKGEGAKIAVYTGPPEKRGRSLRTDRKYLQTFLERRYPLDRWQIVQRTDRSKWNTTYLYLIWQGTYTEAEQIVWRREQAEKRAAIVADQNARAARNEQRRRDKAIGHAKGSRR